MFKISVGPVRGGSLATGEQQDDVHIPVKVRSLVFHEARRRFFRLFKRLMEGGTERKRLDPMATT